jgi:ubiquinone/menaquinone biosynthesis C-methylase UbiE
MKKEEIKKVVRKSYAKIAKQESSCCAPVDSCCGTADLTQDISKKIGYSEEDIKAVPEGANLGLGCGNPVAIASLKEGETVLDLGSGAGFDCFLAADKVGKKGRVIGIDMTPEMVEKARENVQKGEYENVEFRLGEIENLPIADSSADIIISNCVINLAPDKKKIFKEAFRALRPGGRLMISDIVLLKELPDTIKNSIEAYVGCVSGAVMKDKYIGAIEEAGFKEVRIIDETSFPYESLENDPTTRAIIENLNISPEKAKEAVSSVISINIYGLKPLQNH